MSNIMYPYSDPKDPNKVWLEAIYRKYYFKNFTMIELDEPLFDREFGFRLFDGKMHRHLTFKNRNELFAYVVKYSPADIYCSSSKYHNPSALMDQKDWKGSDLIFDIDGKDLKLECSINHNITFCHHCRVLTSGVSSKCPKCSSSNFLIIEIPCRMCIKALKNEVKKLYQILYEDFNISFKDVHTYFSGNNGFHIHVIAKEYFSATSKERQAITQYLLLKDFRLENLGLHKDKNGKLTPIKNKILYNKGWRSRFFKNLKLNLYNNKIDDRFVKKFEQLVDRDKVDFVELVNNQIRKLSVRIDPAVTIDIHRIFRLAGSINSKSGLTKTVCKNLDEFDPLRDSCHLDNSEVNIVSKIELDLFLKAKKFEISKGRNIVPGYVAAYLINKSLAQIELD